MSLANIVSSKGEKLRRELLKAKFSKEDKQKASKLINNSGSGNVSKYAPRYYKFAEDTPDDISIAVVQISSSLKVIMYGNIGIYPTLQGYNNTSADKKYIGFSLTPFYVELNNIKQFIYTLDEYLNIAANEDEEGVNLIKQYVTEITEDEYYKID